MSRCSEGIVAIIVVSFFGGNLFAEDDYIYQDDDLLCRGSWSLEIYQDRIRQHEYQKKAAYIDYQNALAYQAIADQRSQERIKIARRARIEKEARRREEMIARRKAENALKNAAVTDSTKATK